MATGAGERVVAREVKRPLVRGHSGVRRGRGRWGLLPLQGRITRGGQCPRVGACGGRVRDGEEPVKCLAKMRLCDDTTESGVGTNINTACLNVNKPHFAAASKLQSLVSNRRVRKNSNF